MTKKVQLLIGTRKGAFIAEGDTHRKKWKVKGPSFPGKDVFHVIADPRNEGHLYAAANSGFVGPTLARSTDGGHKWKPVGMPWLEVKASDRPPDFPKLTTGIVNLWNITPGPENEPKSLYLGIDPASLYRSDDSGASWTALPGLNEHETRPKWNPGAGGMCLHTIVLDPRDPKRMYVGISAAGTFRSDDGGERWQPLNKGVKVSFLPDPYPIVGQCVHKIALDPGNPDIVYRQDHDGIYVSMDRMENWKRIGRPLDFDFGFATATVGHLPGYRLLCSTVGRDPDHGTGPLPGVPIHPTRPQVEGPRERPAVPGRVRDAPGSARDRPPRSGGHLRGHHERGDHLLPERGKDLGPDPVPRSRRSDSVEVAVS